MPMPDSKTLPLVPGNPSVTTKSEARISMRRQEDALHAHSIADRGGAGGGGPFDSAELTFFESLEILFCTLLSSLNFQIYPTSSLVLCFRRPLVPPR